MHNGRQDVTNNRQPNGAMPNGDRTTAIPDPVVRRHSTDESHAGSLAAGRGVCWSVDSRDAIVAWREVQETGAGLRAASCLLPIDGISGLPR